MTTRPGVLAVEPLPDGVRLQLHIPPSLAYFPDHFPRFPMVPGVTQLDWAVGLGAEHLGIRAPFRRISALKFQHPLLPDDRPSLLLTRGDGLSVAFAYEKNGRACSSGRITFGP